MLDIEFASGTSVQFELKQPMKIEEVRELIAQADRHRSAQPQRRHRSIPAAKAKTVYEVITPNADSAKVKDAILKVFEEDAEGDAALQV